MTLVRESRYFDELFSHYPRSPSIALCRIPEVELLSRVTLSGPTLDHCCGDGYIAALAYPGRRIEVGVDFNAESLQRAEQRGSHSRLLHADVGVRLPLEDGSMQTVINNSGIEHVSSLDQALVEVARVLRPGGRFYFNVLNDRYFANWPLSEATARSYREWQPFLHALDEPEWTGRLGTAGFSRVEFQDYFEPEASRVLAELDYKFSALYLRKRPSVRPLLAQLAPSRWLKEYWQRELGDLSWTARPGRGCGFMVTAIR